jgi:hypothetical protein
MMSAESSIARRLQNQQRMVSNGYTPGVDRVKVQDFMNISTLKRIVEGAGKKEDVVF